MKNWKRFVNYEHYKDPSIPKQPRFIERLPAIQNEGLFVDPSTYLKEKEETEQIITPDFHNKFKYVSKEVWQYLISKYGGGPEFKMNLSYTNNEENLHYVKVTFMILPRKDKFSSQAFENVKASAPSTFCCWLRLRSIRPAEPFERMYETTSATIASCVPAPGYFQPIMIFSASRP